MRGCIPSVAAAIILATACPTQDWALAFDGAYDFVALTNGPEVIHRPTYTIEAWVRRRAPLAGQIYTECTVCGVDLGLSVFADGTASLWRLQSSGGPGMTVSSSSNALPLDTWTHVAAVFDITVGTTLYVNGVAVASNQDTNPYTTAQLIGRTSIGGNWVPCINGSPGYQNHFAGDVSELRLWSTARTAANIVSSMPTGSLTGTEAGLIALWRLDEVGQQTIHDAASSRTAILGFTPQNDVYDPAWISPVPTITATAVAYGQGCGVPPIGLTPDPAARPLLGHTGRANVVNAPSIVMGGAIGWSRTFSFPILLPYELSSIGMPGCYLVQSNEVFGLGVTATGAGTGDFSFAVPNHFALVGTRVFLQAFAFAPGANQLQIVSSNGVEWLIGDM